MNDFLFRELCFGKEDARRDLAQVLNNKFYLLVARTCWFAKSWFTGGIYPTNEEE